MEMQSCSQLHTMKESRRFEGCQWWDAVVEAREDERVRGGLIRSEAMRSKLQKERRDENTFGNRWF
jgi:hypothetical protein